MTDLRLSEASGQPTEMRVKPRFRAWRMGPVILTTCIQGSCRRIVDRAVTVDREGNRYQSVAIILRPWRRNRWGDYQMQRALVLGWRKP